METITNNWNQKKFEIILCISCVMQDLVPLPQCLFKDVIVCYRDILL